MNTPDEALVRLTDVYKTYLMGEVEVPVLRGVSMEIRKAEFLTIWGESGSGKSTLMNLVGGIDRADSGEIVFQGEDITNFSESELTHYRRSQVGFVFQFYNLVPSLTALENVWAAAEIAEDPMDPEEALKLVGLADRKEHFPSQLSGGQQQRIAIARALVKRPALLLCDEPTGALDHDTSIVVLDLLQNLNSETETTLVVITHNPEIAPLADRTVSIVDGLIQGVNENEHLQISEDPG